TAASSGRGLRPARSCRAGSARRAGASSTRPSPSPKTTPMRRGPTVMTLFIRRIAAGCLLALAMAGFATTRASAVPAFAVQTGEPCQACHVGGFGPQLTPFGRQFKLQGYTLRAVKLTVPLSAMVVASYTQIAKGQSPPPAAGFAGNDNFAL